MSSIMREDWIECELGEVLDIERGGSPRPIKEFLTDDEDGINWIKIGDTKGISKYINKTEQKIKPTGLKHSREVYPNDFILSNSMSFGRPYIMGINGAIHDGWLVLRDNYDLLNKDFLYYILSSTNVYSQFDKLATGSTVKNLNIGLVQKVKINLIPKPEQYAIANKIEALFSDLDNGIANFKKAQAQLKVYRQAVLKKAFEGKLSEPLIYDDFSDDYDLESEKGKSKESINQKNHSSDNLPKGWKWVKFEDVLEIVSGKNQKQVENPTGKYPIYGSGGIFGKADDYLCEAGTTIIGRKGTIDNPIYVNEKFWNVDTAFGLSPFKILDKKYLFYFCQGFNFKKLDKSTTIPSLAKRDLLQIEMPLPPTLEEQTQIVAEIERRLSVCEKMERSINESIEKAEALRQSILKKAFEGKLLSKAEIEQCKKEADYEPASELLKKIQAEKLAKEQEKKKKPTIKKKSKK